jgi:hypothetical protein
MKLPQFEQHLSGADVLRLAPDRQDRSLLITHGLVWLTLDGQRWDHWLAGGESALLPAGSAAMLQAWPAASFQLLLPPQAARQRKRRLCWPLLSTRRLSLQPLSTQ